MATNRIDQSSTPRTAPASASSAASVAAPKRKKRTLEDFAAERQAPTAGGKIPARPAVAAAGATTRAQGKAVVDIDAFKLQLRSGVIDGVSLAAFRESRQAAFEARKESTKTSFETMRTALGDAETLRQTVADNLQEIVDLMPKDMVAAANLHKTNKDEEEKVGFFTKIKNWVKHKPEPAHINELELDKLLLKQIDLSEAAANTLEERVKGLDGVEQHLNASRIEFSAKLEETVSDFNSTVEVLREIDTEIKGIEDEQATLDPMSREYGENEKSLFALKNQSLELTRLAAFLNDSIQNYRDFESTGEQLATLLTNVKSNADRVLLTAFKMLETQSVTTGVIAQVASVINAADWTMLVFDTVNQNTVRAIEYISARVGGFAGNMEEWMDRAHGASVQMVGAMLEANLKTEQDLQAYKAQLLADYEAGKRAVAMPTSARPGPRTSNPLRAKSSELSNYLKQTQARQAERAGIKLSSR